MDTNKRYFLKTAGTLTVSSLGSSLLTSPANGFFAPAFWQNPFKPSAFSFTDKTGVIAGSTVTSNAVTLTGVGTHPVTAVGNNCTIQRNQTGGFYSKVSGFKNGDKIEIQMVAGAGSATSTVKVGATTSSVWSVTGNADPYFANVVLLMQMDDLTDSTGRHSFSVIGGAQITTGTKRFGTGSLKLVSGGCIRTANSDDFFYGTGNFTLEGWALRASGSSITLFNSEECNRGSYALGVSADGTIAANAFRYNTNVLISSSAGAMATNSWYHVAFSREGGFGRIFLNGTMVASGPFDCDISNNWDELNIGGSYLDTCHQYDSFATEAYLDSLRITKGVARYTSNFTTPSAAF